MSHSFPDAPANLQRLIGEAGRRAPERGITLLDNRGRAQDRRSFDQLADAARLMARRLRSLGLEPGDRLMLSLPTSWQWLDVWLGAVFCEALPVAIATPGALGSPATQVEKTLRVAQRIGARFLVCADSVIREARRALDDGLERRALGGALTTRLIDVEKLERVAAASPAPDPDPAPERVAYLQLTSGSTGLPRAVEVLHRGAVHNALASAAGIGAPHPAVNPVLVSWLPLYHDMGLVGNVLNAIVSGSDLYLMNPRTFLARPWVWLEQFAGLGDAMSTAPNFAYHLCVERIGDRQLESLDLSGLRDAMTGSEMVRPETAAAFCERFERAGFDPRRLRPCYGLAEATLAVTVDQRYQGVRTHEVPTSSPGAALDRQPPVVSNGTPVPDTELEIRGPDGRARGELAVGEVWVRCPGVMRGYYDDPEATAEVLCRGWLDTGDLGFLDRDGELYLTGRKKEILILNGQNLMPHEIEWHAESVLGSGGSQRSGAFAVPAPHGEQAVLVLETTPESPEQLERLRRDVARAVGRNLSVALGDLVLVRRGAIPRTTSGKIQRRGLREAYLRGELERLEARRAHAAGEG